MIRSFVAVAAVIAASAVLASSATAAPSWRKLTGDTGTSRTTVAMARAGTTGPLHVVWAAPTTDIHTQDMLFERDVLPSGALGPQRTVIAATGGGSIQNPGIARNPVDGSFWVFAASSSMFGGELFGTQSLDGGATWSTPAAGISASTSAYAADDASAAFASDGSAYQSFGLTFKRTLGLDPAEDDLGNAPGIDVGFDHGCCAYWSQVAIDSATSKPYVAYYSNLTSGRYGLEVVDATSGTVTYASGSADAGRKDSANGGQPTPLTGRIGAPGVYLGYCGGYPNCTAAYVWRYGTTKPVTVGTGSKIEGVRISAAPGGRLWAIWHEGSTLFARRSNPSVTVWGQTLARKLPGTNPLVWRLAGDGSAGYLDAFASLGLGATDSTWTTRILPELSVIAKPKSVLGTTLTVKVADAGAAVAGAVVKVHGVSAKTNAAGIAHVKLAGKAGTATVVATHAGYTVGSLIITLRN